MASSLASELDLQNSWTRAKRDQSDGLVFAVHPLLTQLIDIDEAAWLDALREDVSTESYTPRPCRICAVPKPNGATRPGATLSLRDHVVYTALVARMRPRIHDFLDWGTPPPDFAYRPKTDLSDKEWFQPWFPLWKAFDKRSIKYIDEGLKWVVVADIAGYYENIDLFLLGSDLRALDIDSESLSMLNKCLNRWARVQRRGLPQGFSASNLLGKVYLNSVDRSLAASGLTHLRWVDDYRIFCRTEHEAKRALVKLIDLLGSRGLVVQSAKTEILDGDEAIRQFSAMHSLIEPIKSEFVQELLKAGVLNVPSATVFDIDRAIQELSNDVPLEVARRTYDEYIKSGDFKFNKTLFRFLLRRMAKGPDSYAIEHALSLLVSHSEETMTVLNYASGVGCVNEADDRYVAMIESGEAVYDYQSYQVLSWRLEQSESPSQEFISWARAVGLAPGTPWFLRAAARMIIGRWGSMDDLESLHLCYDDAPSGEEQAEIICTTSRMEKSRRNAFLGHAGADGDLPSRAARLVRDRRMSWV